MTRTEERLRDALALLEQRAPHVSLTAPFIESAGHSRDRRRTPRRWVWPLASAVAVFLIVAAVALLIQTRPSHSPAAHQAPTAAPTANPDTTTCLHNAGHREGAGTTLVPGSPTSLTICQYPDDPQHPVSITTSHTGPVVAALNALPTSTAPANDACRARYPGALPARGTYELHFHYDTGPDVIVNVLPECRPSVNNTSLQADDARTVLPVLRQLVRTPTTTAAPVPPRPRTSDQSSPMCTAGALRISQVLPFGAGMGSVGWRVRIRNDGQHPCWLAGYPILTADGCRYAPKHSCAADSIARLPIIVRHGDVFGVKDPGTRPFELHRHASATFRVGTAAGGAPLPWVLITRLTVMFPGVPQPVAAPTNIIDGVRENGRYILVITALSNDI